MTIVVGLKQKGESDTIRIAQSRGIVQSGTVPAMGSSAINGLSSHWMMLLFVMMVVVTIVEGEPSGESSSSCGVDSEMWSPAKVQDGGEFLYSFSLFFVTFVHGETFPMPFVSWLC